MEHFDHSYWLNNIKHINQNNQNIVFLVQNKIDMPNTPYLAINDSCREEYKLTDEYIFRISVEKTFEKIKKYVAGFDWFRETLLEQIKIHIAKTENSTKWQEIKNAIQDNWAKDEILSYADYEERCKKIKPKMTASELDTLTEILHKKGVLFHFKHIDALKDKVFVSPVWLIDCIYKVLDYKVKEADGEFDFEHIEQISKIIGKISAAELLALLINFELVFEIERKDKKHFLTLEVGTKIKKYFVAPQYLPARFNDEAQNEVDKYRAEKKIEHCFTLFYPNFLPISVFLKFLAIYGKIHINYWYNNNELVFKKDDCIVFAKCVRNKDEDVRTIAITIQDENLVLAKALFKDLYKIDNTKDLSVSVDKTHFVNVKKLEEHLTKHTASPFIQSESKTMTMVKIKDFAFLFDNVHLRPERESIFIAYEPNETDNPFFDDIKKQLETLKTNIKDVVVWDYTQIRAGDNKLKETKNALAKAKVVVALISPFFLKSNYALLEEVVKDGGKLMPVLLRQTIVAQTLLGKYEAVNKDNPLNAIEKEAERDNIYVKLVDDILEFYKKPTSISER